MHGNVWEYLHDRYGAYDAVAREDPTGPATGALRIARGGAWESMPNDCRSAYRKSFAAGHRSSSVGFRPVRTAVP